MDSKRIRAPTLIACIAVLLALTAAPAAAERESCTRGPGAFPGYNVISGSGAIEGTPRNDFITGSSGPDTIRAGYGRDVVCAGDGNDVVYGGGSSDDLHGQLGNDTVFGELLDDELYGSDGRDVLIGGHGTDELFGDLNNDWLRGGTNVDHYHGGENALNNDNDVVSFTDATASGGKVPGWDGVVANLTSTADPVTGQPPHTAKGGGEDTIEDVESVVGSGFDDRVYADTAEPNRHLYGGMGSDSCSGGCDEPATSLSAPFAYLDSYSPFPTEPTPPEKALIVVGGSASETFTLSNSGSSYTATASAGGSPETLATTGGCSTPTRGTVTCSLGGTPTAGAATWFGGDGNDTITDRTPAPNGVTTDLDGGDDSDTITGSAGSETIFSGNSGSDELHGGDGGDALLALGTGGDLVYAEAGNDQLATSDPCQGHVYRGGPDQDVAGFARTTTAVNASLGNPAGDPSTVGSSWYGPAFTRAPEGNNSCPGGAVTWVGADSEILEGTNHGDVLTGNGDANSLWARAGDDRVEGLAGDDNVLAGDGADLVFAGAGTDDVKGGNGEDRLHGEEGEDTLEGQTNADMLWGEDGNDGLFGGDQPDELFGGNANDLLVGDLGADELFGQAGNDRLRARDGVADSAVNCGADRDEPTEADPFDPLVNCE
jgi:Ca2+-binding RTX toxin-like protein